MAKYTKKDIIHLVEEEDVEFIRLQFTDMYLYPDLDTFTIFPWRPQQGKAARFICDVYRADRTPFEGDCRYILKKAIGQAAEMGYVFEVGPECEFFLFNADENGRPTTNTDEQAGFFDMGPLDNGENRSIFTKFRNTLKSGLRELEMYL